MLEWKKLGEICTYYRGVTYNKKQEVSLGSGGTKILRANNITLDSNTLNYDDIKEISSDVKIKDYQWLNPNDILICAGSGSKEHVGKVAFIFDRIGYAYGGFMGKLVVSEGLQSRFLFHVICSHLFKKYLEVALNSTTINNLNAEIVNNFLIPVPSLTEQTRIVGILDTFTASIENLKQQIAQRRKQYEHYRDQLLDLEGKEGVEMMRLGEITKVLRGKRLTKNLLDDNAEYPVYHGGIEPLGRYSQYNREANTVMVINVGASAGTVGFSDIRFWSSDGCFCISHSDLINNKYLYYYLETKTHYLQSQVRYAGIPTLDNLVVEKVLVPIISLQNQSRIVSILDTFEDSIANLEQQLAQRERQYEYYRNQLLTFE